MNLLEFLKQEKIFGIVRSDNVDSGIMIAQAYIDAGLRFIELNCPLEVLMQVSAKNNAVIAQGGVITSWQAQEAIDCGANIISSPIYQQNLVHFCTCHQSFYLPAVTTPNEAYNAWKSRNLLIKIYPVAQMGGAQYIKELIKPMPFLNVLPCGFVKIEKIKDYLEAGAVAVGVGREFYKSQNESEIKDIVKSTIESLK